MNVSIPAYFPKPLSETWRYLKEWLLQAMKTCTGRDAAYLAKEQRFTTLTDRYSRLINGICLSFSGNADDYADLRQDVLLNIWKGLEGFRDESSESTWIYRVTLNTCVSYQKKRKRHEGLSMQELYAHLYDNSSTIEQEQYRQMYLLIGKLRPIDRSVVLMWLNGKRYDEIADVVGMSRDSVASRLKRSKQYLAEIYNTNKI